LPVYLLPVYLLPVYLLPVYLLPVYLLPVYLLPVYLLPVHIDALRAPSRPTCESSPEPHTAPCVHRASLTVPVRSVPV
jgi:hypothetical protein